MPKLKSEMAFATLIPEFILQFLSSAQVDKDSITCLDFEDLRDAVKTGTDRGLDGIRRFLSAEHEDLKEFIEDDLSRDEKLEKMSDELDEELKEVDDELYHRYTPGELKYMFGEIIDNIEMVYGMYKAHADTNLGLSVGFKLKNGLESGLVVEFLSISESPEYLEDVYFVPMKNYFVSDEIVARVYLVYEKEKEDEYEAEFSAIASILQMKQETGHSGHKHGPDCGHIH
jgi:hypothetical protein